MARRSEAETTANRAGDRLVELQGKLKELRSERRSITERLVSDHQKDKIQAIIDGQDLDSILGEHHEALEVLDRKIRLLEAAIREQHALADREHAARRRAELEKDRPLYIQAVRRYVQAVRDLHAAQQALQGHEAYKVSPVGFPGLHMQNFSKREQSFAETLRLRGIDPSDVGITLPERPAIQKKEITEEMRKALRKRYFTAGKMGDIHDFSHVQQ
jgi:chromosome segregation ATPase